MTLQEVLAAMPLVAVLRHIQPHEAIDIGTALVDSGFVCLEVPMNSPEPIESIRLLAEQFGERALVGAGTVIEVGQVQAIADAGGKIIIMPHTDVAVIQKAKSLGLCCVPGVSTPSEAYAALHAGADGLKLFPAEGHPPAVLKAMRAILPKGVPVIPTGGISPEKMADYSKAGASGFGLGSALYRAGDTAEVVRQRAVAFVDAMRIIQGEM